MISLGVWPIDERAAITAEPRSCAARQRPVWRAARVMRPDDSILVVRPAPRLQSIAAQHRSKKFRLDAAFLGAGVNDCRDASRVGKASHQKRSIASGLHSQARRSELRFGEWRSRSAKRVECATDVRRQEN